MRKPAAVFTIAVALGAIIFVPGADARAPTKIKACQTISQPGSYELGDNLVPTGFVDCLVITADGVTVDLAGFSISGSPTAFGRTAILAQVVSGIAVRNGYISNFDTGVDLSLARLSIVEGLRLFGGRGGRGGPGIIARGIVKGNTVGNFGIGISVTGTVTGNDVNSNTTGIEVSQGSTAIGNTATAGTVGFSVSCPSNLTNNTALNNIAANLLLSGEGCHNEDNLAP
jgi:hypothetical protein